MSELTGKCFIVTGVAGFIGSSLARKLLDGGARVYGIDNFKTGKPEVIPAGIEFFEADCAHFDFKKRFSRISIEAILHVAGQSSGDVSFDDPSADLSDNVTSLLNLFDYMNTAGTRRILLASSMGVYGNTDDGIGRESAVCQPLSCYGVGKLAAENYCKVFERQYGIQYTAFRMFNVYGPGQNMQNLRQGMVSIYLAQLLQGQEVRVRGSVERFRDFVYIDDVVRAWTEAIGNPKTFGQVFNLGTGRKCYVGQLIELIGTLLGKNPQVIADQSTRGDQFGVVAEMKKFEEFFSWKPSVQLEEGLRRFVQWNQQGLPL